MIRVRYMVSKPYRSQVNPRKLRYCVTGDYNENKAPTFGPDYYHFKCEALRRVKRRIARLGGDPARFRFITVPETCMPGRWCCTIEVAR